MVKLGLEHFKFTAAKPRAEGDRVEINLDTQVLTVYKNWQPILLTTTSTGSGTHFCGGTDGCQYAITPTGHFHFYYLHWGWDKGKLGRCGTPTTSTVGSRCTGSRLGAVVPGVARVRSHPDGHRQLLPDLVTKGESVYVVGTPKQPGSSYVGPAPVTTTTAPPPTRQCRRRTPSRREKPHKPDDNGSAPGDNAAAKTTTTAEDHNQPHLRLEPA